MARTQEATDKTLIADKKTANVASNEDLLKQVNDLTALVQSLLASKSIDVAPTAQEAEQEDFDSIDIKPNDYIRVISLCPFKLNLSRERGDKLPKKFEKFGEEKRIMYDDLLKIMENHPTFLKEGYFYIADRRFIRKHGLEDEIYSNLLSKEKIEQILAGNLNIAVPLFESANDIQREFICDIFVEKILGGENVDLNLIDKLSRISGIKIHEKAEEAKEYLNSRA